MASTSYVLFLDNRWMSAISALQREQYGRDFRTSDRVAVDYAAVARAVSGVAAYEGGYSPAEPRAALERARTHPGLSVVHAPVYYGEHPLGRLGAYGRWNVGNWCAEVEARYHRQLP